MKKFNIFLAVGAIAAIIGGGWYLSQEHESQESSTSQEESESATPDPACKAAEEHGELILPFYVFVNGNPLNGPASTDLKNWAILPKSDVAAGGGQPRLSIAGHMEELGNANYKLLVISHGVVRKMAHVVFNARTISSRKIDEKWYHFIHVPDVVWQLPICVQKANPVEQKSVTPTNLFSDVEQGEQQLTVEPGNRGTEDVLTNSH